jgi:hypothetical protein
MRGWVYGRVDPEQSGGDRAAKRTELKSYRDLFIEVEYCFSYLILSEHARVSGNQACLRLILTDFDQPRIKVDF